MRRKGRIVHPRPDIAIFTDGSANGQGGAGYVFLLYRNDEFECYGGAGEPKEELTTNNQGELRAIHLAMLHLLKSNEPRKITFYSDSKYALGIIFKTSWKVRANEVMVNDLRDYIAELRKIGCDVKGIHAPREESHIMICDKYANALRKEGEVLPYVRR